MDFPRPPRRSGPLTSSSRRQETASCDSFLATSLPPYPRTTGIPNPELVENASNGSMEPLSSSASASGSTAAGSDLSRILRNFADQHNLVDQRLRNIETALKETKKSLDDLTELIRKNMKDSFTIRGSRYEVCSKFATLFVLQKEQLIQALLKIEVAKLFCSSLRRETTEDDIRVIQSLCYFLAIVYT